MKILFIVVARALDDSAKLHVDTKKFERLIARI